MTLQSLTLKEADKIILEKINSHDSDIFLDSEFFLDLLKHSLSLENIDKQRVIDSIPNLLQHQFDELIKVFLEERTKFRDLMKQYPEDVKKLVEKQTKSWIEIAEIYKINEESKMKKLEDQAKIDDLKSKLWL